MVVDGRSFSPVRTMLKRLTKIDLEWWPDVDPSLYGEEKPSRAMITAISERDQFELAPTEGSSTPKPSVLGICRGVQLINVALEDSTQN